MLARAREIWRHWQRHRAARRAAVLWVDGTRVQFLDAADVRPGMWIQGPDIGQVNRETAYEWGHVQKTHRYQSVDRILDGNRVLDQKIIGQPEVVFFIDRPTPHWTVPVPPEQVVRVSKTGPKKRSTYGHH